MTTVYLVRHAEAEGNLYRIAQGQGNSNLTDRGWRQVRALEKRFRDIHIDAVYSSDLYRTCATASSVYQAKGLPLHRERGLREICVGIWEHRTWGDIDRFWPEELSLFRRCSAEWSIEGGETLAQLLERVLTTVKRIAADHDGETIALFSHGYAIRVLLAHLQGYSLDQVGQTITGDNTAVSCLEVNGDEIRVVFRDDNSHLKTPEYLAGEKVVKRNIALEPGLYYEPLRLPEQETFYLARVEEALEDCGVSVPAGTVRLNPGEADRTLIAYRIGGEPVGAVQFGEEGGEITLLCVCAEHRRKGYGVQLIGQAVQYWRGKGADRIWIRTGREWDCKTFLQDYGFSPDGTVMKKDIYFIPEYLGEE